MADKGHPNVFLWCSKISKPVKRFGLTEIDMRNCVVKLEGYKACTFHGDPAKCVETAFAYQVPPRSYPKYRKSRKKK